MPAVSHILFDFGNIIIDIDIPLAIERLGELRNDEIPEDQYEKELKALVFKYERGALSTDLFINAVLKMADRKVQALDVINAWNSMLVGIPEYRLGLLRQLKNRYGLYMLSNTNELHIEWVHKHLRAAHGLSPAAFEEELFDAVYYSHLIKARKPDAEAFRAVVKQSMISPERTIFIDDMEQNIEGASRLGFHVLHSPEEDEIATTLKLMGYY